MSTKLLKLYYLKMDGREKFKITKITLAIIVRPLDPLGIWNSGILKETMRPVGTKIPLKFLWIRLLRRNFGGN